MKIGSPSLNEKSKEAFLKICGGNLMDAYKRSTKINFNIWYRIDDQRKKQYSLFVRQREQMKKNFKLNFMNDKWIDKKKTNKNNT